MKKTLTLFAAALAVLVTTVANAQSVHMKADIPFNFIISGATLPAGEYSVASVDVGGHVLLISDLSSQRNKLIHRKFLPLSEDSNENETGLPSLRRSLFPESDLGGRQRCWTRNPDQPSRKRSSQGPFDARSGVSGRTALNSPPPHEKAGG